MATFKGALYVGSGIQGGGVDTQNRVGPAPPELIRIHPDGSWDLLVGDSRDTPDGRKECLSGYLPGFDNFFNGYFWRLCEHEGWLYVSTFEWSSILGYANRRGWPQAFTNIINYVDPQTILDNQSGFDLYRSYDGENWVPVTTNGMDNPYNMGLRTMVSSPLRPVPRHRQPLRSEDHAARRRSLRAESARRLRGPLRTPPARLAMRPLRRRWWRRCRAAGRAPRLRCRPAPASSADLAYGPEPAQCLDAYLPAGRPTGAILVIVHGGAWAIGDKANPGVVAAKVAHWLPSGVVVVSVNYRLLPLAGVLQQAGDVARAIAFVQKRAAGWQADPARLVVVGHSTGAHLAALLAADPALARGRRRGAMAGDDPARHALRST